ncbi:MAG: hypothetical protein ACXWHF_09425 [Chthoniobacterales bacterium]
MKKMLMVSNGEHFAARFIKATAIMLIGLALGTAFWVATVPSAQAAGESGAQMIAAQLHGKTIQNASKAELIAAVCAALKSPGANPAAIMQAAVAAHQGWRNDLLRGVFDCVGKDNCALLGQILRGARAGSPSNAAGLTDLATQLAPDCASAFGAGTPGGGGEGEGVFGNPPGINLNPPPGSMGGGGQGTIVAVCLNGETLFVTPERAQEILNQNPGATLGACQVTATTNR